MHLGAHCDTPPVSRSQSYKVKVVLGICCALIIAQLVRQNRFENRTSCNSFSPDFQVSGTFERHVTRYDRPIYRAIGRLRAGESYRVAAPYRRDDEQRESPYDAKCNVAEIGVVNMGEIGAVRKRSR